MTRTMAGRAGETGQDVAGFVTDDGAMTNATLHAETVTTGPVTDRGRHRTAAITAQGLVRTFGGATAVDGLDLDILQGEIYGFLGPNGAGKSTTGRARCTRLAPSAGRAT